MACRRPAALVAAAVAMLAFAACDTDDGRTMRPPAPGATAPVLGTTSVVQNTVGTVVDNGVRLLSSAFADRGPIPSTYASCTGDNVSPPLEWTGIPSNVVEIALTVTDPSAENGGFIHWVVTGLPASLLGLAEGSVPEGAVEARNDTTEFGWYGPCPPAGQTHDYVFTLYALTERTNLEPGVSGRDAIARIAEIPGYAATLTGIYTG
jgi:Raf kinase inhibitor-like YbhB/YbcL family protein